MTRARKPTSSPDSRRAPFARKRFGQHFLRDRATLQAIADAIEPLAEETVVEIGPGRGALTDLLADRARRVVAVEIDRDLASLLRERYAGRPHVEIVEADVLARPLGELVEGEYCVAANVPYYITTPILFHALVPPRAKRAVYLVQREVADRMAATPGSKTYGALSVNLQGLAEVELVRAVPPSAFTPPPTVDSAVVRVTPRASPMIPRELERRFRTFVQGAFGMRRKQIRVVLRALASTDAERADAWLVEAEIDGAARPETLTAADFTRLIGIVARAQPPGDRAPVDAGS